MTTGLVGAPDKAKVKAVKVRAGASGRVWAMTSKAKGGSGQWYELTVDRKGRLQCECFAYRFSGVKKDEKSCKHLVAAFEAGLGGKVKANKTQSVRRKEKAEASRAKVGDGR